jgi:hypothetical protein
VVKLTTFDKAGEGTTGCTPRGLYCLTRGPLLQFVTPYVDAVLRSVPLAQPSVWGGLNHAVIGYDCPETWNLKLQNGTSEVTARREIYEYPHVFAFSIV